MSPQADAGWAAAMRRGDWVSAWAISDAVLAGQDLSRRDDPSLPYHRRFVWDGRRLDGLHVLVRCYHGLGDTLQFARFLPAVRARAASLTVEVQPELLALLAGSFGVDRWVGFDVAAPLPASECDVEIMELCHALRLPPDGAPYLRTPPQPLSAAAVGLCWRAGNWDAARSVPLPELATLAEGRPAVALQPGAAPPGIGWTNPEGAPARVEQTAGLLAGLSTIVTVDTMIAHLAGALGRPACVLLKHNADWRWGETEVSPWYPSLQLFRQETAGDWQAPLARCAARTASRR